MFCATGTYCRCPCSARCLQNMHGRLGYDTTFQLPLKIVGRNGVELNERWKPHPVSYLSVAVDGFPNLFMSFGPNSGVGSGSLLALMEFEIMYAVQAAAKMQRERLKSIEVKPEALRDFDQYLEVSFFCISWAEGLTNILQSYFPKVTTVLHDELRDINVPLDRLQRELPVMV